MLSVIAAAATAVAANTATPLSSHEPQSIAQFLQAEGYKAKIDKDGDGDPMIRSGADGLNFFIYFYGCENHSRCKDVQFSVGFDTADGKGPSLEKINEWNHRWRFSRAFLDKENDPMLQMDVMFSGGEMSQQMFRENLDMWTDVLGKFKTHIDW